jgi:hypothetical protein
MGLCQSVALWKDKVYADRRRRGHGHDDVDNVMMMMGGGVSDYGLPVGAGAFKAEEAVVPPRPSASGVLERAGGTPARPIWQRRVLMGVKCQLPRFSGMILYDERGRPVCGGVRDRARDQVSVHRIHISLSTNICSHSMNPCFFMHQSHTQLM